MARFAFEHSYSLLPVRLIHLNRALASALDATALQGEDGAEIFAGNRLPEGESPIAIAYTGHQFGHFVPQLDDGKASAATCSSRGPSVNPIRRGVMRARRLGPLLCEYLVSEAMAALSVPTTPTLAALVAQWTATGFIHGVMNTNNMSVAGETIDYGPCTFMDVYDLETVFSSIDHGGRYAYTNQAPVTKWNLAWLA